MFTLINIFPAIKKHFETILEDSSIEAIIVLFIIIPALISGALILFSFNISLEILNSIITSFSIFIGLISSIIILLLDKSSNQKSETADLIEHLAYNSTYGLILGLVILFLSIIGLIAVNHMIAIILVVVSFILYFLIFNFIINLLIISKRFFVLITTKFK